MKAIGLGIVLTAVLSVGAWWVLNDVVPYTEGERTGDSVRLD
ncbi:hypothetical protein [Jannaschia aquimarina]|uniref:Uncharacterized protein n=1 Tax=Jannaschia aquimarina TaxID=935700 RepID=A0A0D1EIP5_9RHOB|nr:hypothetical protein [Jannaschia aquimarina]KIT15705.1 hypothetical protein jaqu_25820 [Jannaschia aquimarina]SNT38910.1 hypothetical protein SAMN05421775_11422 [Jannaschia aquimarina]